MTGAKSIKIRILWFCEYELFPLTEIKSKKIKTNFSKFMIRQEGFDNDKNSFQTY